MKKLMWDRGMVVGWSRIRLMKFFKENSNIIEISFNIHFTYFVIFYSHKDLSLETPISYCTLLGFYHLSQAIKPILLRLLGNLYVLKLFNFYINELK